MYCALWRTRTGKLVAFVCDVNTKPVSREQLPLGAVSSIQGINLLTQAAFLPLFTLRS